MKRLFLTACLAVMPLSQMQAHPHLFVGVTVAVIFDGDRPSAVQLDWAYDEYFSLLVTSDLGIDTDGDMALDDVERQKLANEVASWATDFSGNLDVTIGGKPVKVGAPDNHAVGYANGQVSETHQRSLSAEEGLSGPMSIRVYDPFYYVAYQIDGPITVKGRDDCTVAVQPPDLNAAYSAVDEFLYGRPAADVGADEQFPEVGVQFAETIILTCGS